MTHRIPLGNYNKYVGYALAWFLRRTTPTGTQILLRGRGKRIQRNWRGQRVRVGDRYGIPLKYASRVGIYVVYTMPAEIIGYQYRRPVAIDPVPMQPPAIDWASTNNLETCERSA